MKKALLIIDAQNYFINEYTKDIPTKIAELISKKKFDLVLFFKFINSLNSNFVKLLHWKKMLSSPDTDIVPQLIKFTTRENVFEKTAFSAFKSPAFLKLLREKRITKLYICGFNTDGCVLTTAVEAFDLGFDVKVLLNLCASRHGPTYHDNTLKILEKNMKNVLLTSSTSFESHPRSPKWQPKQRGKNRFRR